jgi:O-antigen/teichoic acid export membrane protein
MKNQEIANTIEGIGVLLIGIFMFLSCFYALNHIGIAIWLVIIGIMDFIASRGIAFLLRRKDKNKKKKEYKQFIDYSLGIKNKGDNEKED